MRQVAHIIRKTDVEKERIQGLKFELDYQLASLFDAMTNKDEKEMEESKKRLNEIYQLLEELNALG